VLYKLHNNRDVLLGVLRLRRSLPSSVIARAQSDVVLDCAVVGHDASLLPTIKWFKNGEVVVTSDYFQVEHSGQRLRILGLVPSDSGVYQCIIGNEAGVIQSATRLTVLPLGLLVVLYHQFRDAAAAAVDDDDVININKCKKP